MIDFFWDAFLGVMILGGSAVVLGIIIDMINTVYGG